MRAFAWGTRADKTQTTHGKHNKNYSNLLAHFFYFSFHKYAFLWAFNLKVLHIIFHLFHRSKYHFVYGGQSFMNTTEILT